VVDSLANIIKTQPAFFTEHFSKYAKVDSAFVALNTAFAQDGVVIYIPDGKIIEDPIHILNITGEAGKNILAQPRNLIVMGRDTQVKLVESYHSRGTEANFSNVVTEVINGEGSYVELYKIQDENHDSFHVNLTQVEQQKGSNFTTYTVSLGGAITRNDLNAVLDAENVQANLYGLYIIEGTQHVDNHSLIDHAKPNCESRELYKGVLGGKSRGVFNGKVFVRKDAQKTNAYQSNKAMLLSKEAMIDTKPQLEIYADDVKCSHGAAIGQLDEESVFYLRSRGIGEEQAKAVLIRAFANDVFEEIKLEPLHTYLNKLVLDKLK
jgi:Fe-S cluster assembly protein SufD